MHTQKWMTLILTLVLLPGLVHTAWAAPAAARVNDPPASVPQRLGSGDVPAGLSGEQWTSMQEQMRLAEYQFTWQVQEGEWAYRAPNRLQGLSLALGQEGLTARAAGWQFGQRLAAYGAQSLPVVIPEGGLSAEKAQVTYRWDANLSEEYTNTPAGVEQTVTMYAPSEEGGLTLEYALSGDLTPSLDGRGGLRLNQSDGVAVLGYDRFSAHDASGRQLPMRLALTAGGLRITLEAGNALYPLTLEARLQSEAAVLHASDAQYGDAFGFSVAVSGDVIVVGAPYEAGGEGDPFPYAGAAYVFHRTQGGADVWGEVQILRASDTQADDWFGISVAVSGDVIVVGAIFEDGGMGNPILDAGAAYIFQRTQGGADNWGEVTILRASDAQPNDNFGYSVAISGDSIIVGVPHEAGGAGNPYHWSGAAYVFQRSEDGADNWGEVKILRASDAQSYDLFGASVAVSGDVIVVGAYQENGGAGDPLEFAGAAYIFQRMQGGADEWGEVKILHASDAQAWDWFGHSVAVSGDVIVIGAPYEDGGAGDPLQDAGAAYVFHRMQGGADGWGEVQILHASDAQGDDCFGWAVAVSGDVIVVGAPYEDGGTGDPIYDAGAAYVFQRTQGGADAWGEVQILRASDAQLWDWFGNSVAVSGDSFVVGACNEDGGSGDPLPDAGAAYVFQREAHIWLETAIDHASDAQVGDYFGYSTAVSGDVMVVGAPYEDGGAGNPLDYAGAAYVFQRTQGGANGWGEVKLLRASDTQAYDDFGTSVAVSGDMIVIGADNEGGGAGDPLPTSGAAYVFQRTQGGTDSWGEVQILHASDAQADDHFGNSVGVSGDVIIVGAFWENGGSGDPVWHAGAAYVFQRTQDGADGWNEVKILHASDAQSYDRFGHSVAVSGDVIVVGALTEAGGPGDPLPEAGAAYVFQRTQGGTDNWGEVQILHASDAQAYDSFGCSVAVWGDVMVIGANRERGGAGDPFLNAGAAYIFQRAEGGADNWGEVRILHASDMQAGGNFGGSVAVSADVIVVGALGEAGGTGDPLNPAGAAYVFQRTQGGTDNWGEMQTLCASDAQAYDIFGYSVAVSGDVMVIGAVGEDGGAGNPLTDAGAAYVFQVGISSNHAPLLDPIGDQSGDEETLITFTAQASDSDTGDTLVFSLDPGAPDGASIDPTSGVFTWIPTEAQGPGVYTGTVRVTDNGIPPLDDFETIQITVSEVNQAPVLELIGDQSGDEGTLITFTASATDMDIPTNTLVFSLDPGAPDGAGIDPISGVFTWIPSEAQGPGFYPVTVRVTDNGIPPMDDFETLQITVSEVNQAPVLATIGDQSGDEGTLITFTASATDSDIPTNTLVFSLDPGAPDGAGIDPTSGIFTWIPTEAQGPGVYPVTVRVSDNGKPPLDDFETLQITVSEVNQAPILAYIGDQTGDEGTLITFTASATDADIPANTLVFSLDAGAPDGAGIDPTSGVFTWTPTEAQGPGVYPVTVRVSDNGIPALDDFETIQITVFEVEGPSYRTLLPFLVKN